MPVRSDALDWSFFTECVDEYFHSLLSEVGSIGDLSLKGWAFHSSLGVLWEGLTSSSLVPLDARISFSCVFFALVKGCSISKSLRGGLCL